MIKRGIKKGQTEVGLGTVLLLVLGFVALVIVIVGFTKGFGFFTRIFEVSKVDTELISQKCNSLLSLGVSGYCGDEVEIGVDSFVNCDYAAKNLGVKVTNPPDSACGSLCTAEKSICTRLRIKDGDNFNEEKVKVNEQTCKYWFERS